MQVDSASRRYHSALFPTRGWYAVSALAFIVFAIYGSLLPFDLRPLRLEDAWHQFRGSVMTLPSGRISRTDVLANILLFVPVGFSLSAALLADRPRWPGLVWAIPLIVSLSLLVSMAAEFLQLFTPDHVPSGVDIAAQTVGCVAGILAWTLAGQAMTTWMRETLAAAPQDRVSRALAAYAFLWILFNLAPFDITLDLGSLAERIHSGRVTIIPFSGSELSISRRLWDGLAELLSTIPLGLVGVLGFNHRTNRHPSVAFVGAAGIVVLVELAQIFIGSHRADSGDVLLGAAGAAIGVVAGNRLRPAATSGESGASARVWWPAVALVGGWCLVLAAYHWLPYDFTVDNAAIRRKLAAFSLLPFAGYSQGSYVNALNDLLTKLALAAPLGTAAAYVARSRELTTTLVTVTSMLTAGCIFTAIEGGQFFLPSRVPDPTDILVGMAGTGIGLAVGRWLQAGFRNEYRRR